MLPCATPWYTTQMYRNRLVSPWTTTRNSRLFFQMNKALKANQHGMLTAQLAGCSMVEIRAVPMKLHQVNVPSGTDSKSSQLTRAERRQLREG